MRTIVDFEPGARNPLDATIAALLVALEVGGVEFTNGDRPGVRIKAVKD